MDTRKNQQAIFQEKTLETGWAFAVIGAITDNAGLWQEYWYKPISKVDVSFDKIEQILKNENAQIFIAFVLDELTAIEVRNGQFHGRSLYTAPIPETYISLLEETNTQEQLARDFDILVSKKK